MTTFTKDSILVATRQEIMDTCLEQQELLRTQQSKVEELEFQIDWFKRQIFGGKSERFIPSSDLQTALDLGVVSKQDLEKEEETESISYDRKKKTDNKTPAKGHGRGVMPTHLPIKKTTIEPQEDTTGMEKIGEEVSWYYEMEKPSSLHVVMII